jgi:hypothetical protein
MADDQDHITLKVKAQPDDITCGPTCLHAVYKFFGLNVDLMQVISDVCMIPSGGTLAPFLACHALQSGFAAQIYTFNVTVFDPTWFSLPPSMIATKLDRQIQAKKNDKLKIASTAYREFIKLGGELSFEDLTPDLLRDLLSRRIPVITGLSATYLYKCAREIPATSEPDDVLGEPSGHFVVLHGFNESTREVLISDPYYANPYNTHQYSINIDHLICSILLGVVTYDANILIIKKKEP